MRHEHFIGLNEAVGTMQNHEQMFQQASMQMSREFTQEYATAQQAPAAPVAQATGEKRSNTRRRALKAGIIAYNDGNMTFPCVVRDISDAGARLKTDVNRHPPDTFQLQTELGGLIVDCQVVWRDGQQVGVRFISQPQRTVPRCAQIIQISDAKPEATRLLRKPLGT